jgi:hypothetical protein
MGSRTTRPQSPISAVLASMALPLPARACHDSGFMDGDGPRFGAMIALVAIVVATVILVFFGIGYALGRLFL